MRSETFDEIFRYVGHTEPTPEEEEETRKMLKLAKEDIEMRMKRAALGLDF
ncbi:MAG: hypothetical protein RBQ94_02765 [Methanimicrococcus sp.]|nr:hypothetical protein [Methanimicrococcus sp.]